MEVPGADTLQRILDMDLIQYYGMGPMENGSHYDCSYVTVESETHKVEALGETPFCFNVSSYTQEELTKKKLK